jgi:hypothetical protein
MKSTSGLFGIMGILIFCVLMLGCASTPLNKSEAASRDSATAVPDQKKEPEAVRRIVITPFVDMTAIYGNSQTVHCSYCLNYFTTDMVETGASEVLTENLVEAVKKVGRYEVLSVERPPLETGAESANAQHERLGLMKIGKSEGADAVLVGHVYRYIEREGSEYSVRSPASILIDLDLIRVADGHTIWNAHVDETQQSLFENLFSLGTFLERKGKWLTAEDLARHGIDKVLKKMP